MFGINLGIGVPQAPLRILKVKVLARKFAEHFRAKKCDEDAHKKSESEGFVRHDSALSTESTFALLGAYKVDVHTSSPVLSERPLCLLKNAAAAPQEAAPQEDQHAKTETPSPKPSY